MGLYNMEPDPMPEWDNSTINTVATPPETVVAEPQDGDDSSTSTSSSSVPWPGSTFIIRSTSSGRVITLVDGEIILASPGTSGGSIHWVCVETKGWLGFKNLTSGRYLGHNAKGRLCCSVQRHQGWENFCARLRPEGGYILLQTHFERLWHVGIQVERGVEKLAKVGDGGSNGVVWDFIKV